jgi:hypothetical protein
MPMEGLINVQMMEERFMIHTVMNIALVSNADTLKYLNAIYAEVFGEFMSIE